MKKLVALLIVLALLASDFLYEHNRASHVSTPHHPATGLKVTNGGTEFYLGALVVNGTNVPLTNVQISFQVKTH